MNGTANGALTALMITVCGLPSVAAAYACPPGSVSPFVVRPSSSSTIVAAGDTLRFLAATGDCRSISLVLRADDISAQVSDRPDGEFRSVTLRQAGPYVAVEVPEAGVWFYEFRFGAAHTERIARVAVVSTERRSDLVRRPRRFAMEQAERRGGRHLIFTYVPDVEEETLEDWALPWVAVPWRGEARNVTVRLPAGSYRLERGVRERAKLGDTIPPRTYLRVFRESLVRTEVVERRR